MWGFFVYQSCPVCPTTADLPLQWVGGAQASYPSHDLVKAPMNKNFKPRNFTAVFLSVTWFLISIFFITQGTYVTMWSIFAVLAGVIGAAALWVLFTDTYE